MKKKSSFGKFLLNRNHTKAAVASGSLSFFLAASAQSQTIYDWLDTAPDGNWRQGASGARWNPGGLFDEPGFGVLRFNNNHQLNMTNNVAGTYSTHGLIFGSLNTSIRTIGGNTIRFFDSSGTDPYISNDSSATHVINTNLEGDGTSTDPLKLYINSSGGLTFGGTINNQGSTIDVVGSSATLGTTVTFNGIISGGGGLYKNNGNTVVVLNAQNTYTGGTTIDAGTVTLGHATDTLANGGAVTINGGTLGMGSNSDTVGAVTINGGSITGSTGVLTGSSYDARSGNVSAILSGAVALTKTTTGTLTLSGSNSYTGTTAINVGTLAISNNTALGTTAGNTTIVATGGSTGGILSLSNNINSAENISITGNTEQTSFAGVIQNASGINTLSGNITLANPVGNIRLAAYGGELIFAGTITQTTSTRTLVFQAGTGAAITVNNAIANNNGGLNILGFASGSASNGVTLKGGTANNNATNIQENGLLKLGVNDALKITASLSLGTNANFVGNGGFDFGTFDLAGFNQTVGSLNGVRNTGNTIGADSNRIVTNSAASGTSLLTVGNGNASGTLNGVILDGATAAVALTKIGTGTQTLVGNSNYSGVTTISAGTVAITHGNALGSTTGNTTIAATGNTSGGILSLSNNITSAENITITGATEQNSFASAILSTSGINTLSGNITLASPTGGVRFGADAGSLTFSGNISQTGTSRSLAFYANGGAIIVNNAIANNGGVLQVYGNSSVTLKGVNGVGGIGNAVVSQSGTLKLGVSEALNTTGSLDIGVGTALTTDAGTFDLAGFDQTVNALSGIGTAATNSNRRVINSVAGTKTLTIGNGGGTGIFNGVILTGTGQVALIKTGIGTQTLNATNTSTGGTRIDGGILALGHLTDTLANGGAVNVNGGTLALGTNTDTVGAVTLTSGSITGNGTGALTGTSYDVRSGSASAILAGSGVVLTKTTVGTVTLTGANTYTGATTITTGTLQLNGSTHASSALGIGTAGTLSGSGTVNGNATLTGGGIINKSAGSIAGTLGVTGGNWNGAGTVTGAVTSSSGTFTIGSGANLTATTGVSATGGALVVNGTLTGTLNANSSTTVSGTGTITGNATISGIHNPGNSPGIQNIGGNLAYTGGASVVNWELVGNTSTNAANPNAIFDQLIVGGNLDFTNLTTINLAFNVSGSVLWANTFWDTAQSWTLYDVTGTTTNFSNLNLTSINWLDSGSNAFNTVRSGNSFSLTQSGSDVILNYNVVPEPRAALLGGLGLLALLRRRRK